MSSGSLRGQFLYEYQSSRFSARSMYRRHGDQRFWMDRHIVSRKLSIAVPFQCRKIFWWVNYLDKFHFASSGEKESLIPLVFASACTCFKSAVSIPHSFDQISLYCDILLILPWPEISSQYNTGTSTLLRLRCHNVLRHHGLLRDRDPRRFRSTYEYGGIRLGRSYGNFMGLLVVVSRGENGCRAKIVEWRGERVGSVDIAFEGGGG